MSHPSWRVLDATAELVRVVAQAPVMKGLCPVQINPLPWAPADGSCSTSTFSRSSRHSGSDTCAENVGVKVENVHNPDANCPDDDTFDTVGFVVSILPACHSDQGPATGLAAFPACPRTRHRMSHPSWRVLDATAELVRVVAQAPVMKGLCPVQINPLPWAPADGSCSTSTFSRSSRHSGSDTCAENVGVKVENVHNPDANCPDDDTFDTVGFVVSILPACHSDQGPATGLAAFPACPRTRHRMSHPS
ncbi:hypothetical protein ACTWPT_09785 [Nonomuraea sp. 3N208]|uniref:hypothetical protein n=1 Tax=Nonomuraea sp. 3N208 TaxID=3457421 RepID=UPI003FCDE486